AGWVCGGEWDWQRGCRVRGMPADRDAAPVVGDGHRLPVPVQRPLHPVGEPVDHLVDRVVDDLPQQVVVAGGVGAADVHRRPLADRLQPLQHLDVGRAVARLAHRHYFFSCSGNATCTGGSDGGFTLSFFTRRRPAPPRSTASWPNAVSSSLRPFAVSSGMAAFLSLVQRNATTRSSPEVLITVTPRPGPASSLISPDLVTSQCDCSVITATRSRSATGATPRSASSLPGLAKRRPARVDSSGCAASAKPRP